MITTVSKNVERGNKLITDIERKGYNCIGKTEQLKENLSGWWNVKIDDCNRIVFRFQVMSLKFCNAVLTTETHDWTDEPVRKKLIDFPYTITIIKTKI